MLKKTSKDIGSRKDNAAEIPLPEKKGEALEPLLTEADMPSPIREPAPEPEDEDKSHQGGDEEMP